MRRWLGWLCRMGDGERWVGIYVGGSGVMVCCFCGFRI